MVQQPVSSAGREGMQTAVKRSETSCRRRCGRRRCQCRRQRRRRRRHRRRRRRRIII